MSLLRHNFFVTLLPSGKKEAKESDVRPQWMKMLSTSVKNWMSVLPKVFIFLLYNANGNLHIVSTVVVWLLGQNEHYNILTQHKLSRGPFVAIGCKCNTNDLLTRLLVPY